MQERPKGPKPEAEKAKKETPCLGGAITTHHLVADKMEVLVDSMQHQITLTLIIQIKQHSTTII
jgi:hypothetical protein